MADAWASSDPLPRIALADALVSKKFDAIMRVHGYCILTNLPQSTLSRSNACDQQAERLLRAHLQNSHKHRLNKSLHVERSGARCTRLRSACSKSLPLVGVGVHSVKDHAKLQRCQFHLLADEHALKLVPWPTRTQAALRPAVEQCCWDLHALSTKLLAALGAGFGARLERERGSQVATHGDPSVLDLFLYPNAASEVVNMRAHTDPGLLTLTVCSASPGLQVRDRRSGQWVDVEATSGECAPGCDCIVLCGEALQAASREVYAATLHRVRHSEQPRVSTVFELRISDVPMRLPVPPPMQPAGILPSGPAANSLASDAATRAAGTVPQPEQQLAEAEVVAAAQEVEAGREYVLSFVRSRLAHGSSPDDVLREFNVTEAAWPQEALSHMSDVALATLLFDWVIACREREDAAEAFARAEFVTVTPAFADSTGRFVDVHFS